MENGRCISDCLANNFWWTLYTFPARKAFQISLGSPSPRRSQLASAIRHLHMATQQLPKAAMAAVASRKKWQSTEGFDGHITRVAVRSGHLELCWKRRAFFPRFGRFPRFSRIDFERDQWQVTSHNNVVPSIVVATHRRFFCRWGVYISFVTNRHQHPVDGTTLYNAFAS